MRGHVNIYIYIYLSYILYVVNPESPSEGACLRYDESESPYAGACLRYMMNPNRV